MPMNAQYRGPIEMPGVISVFPLPGALLLPRGQMPLNIFEPRYLAMVDDALRDGHRLIGMIQPDIAHGGAADKPSLYKIGCAGRITQFAESGDGRYLIELTGVIKWFDVAKGFGFIEPEAGGEDIFAHFSAIQMDGFRTLKQGGRVRFEVVQGPKGQLAQNISAIDAPMPEEPEDANPAPLPRTA